MIANKTDAMGMKAPARSWKRSTQVPARKESSKRAVSLEAFGPRKRGWGLGLRAGLCLGLGFLALVGIYQPSTADPLPRRVGALGRGMAFLPADALAVQRGSPAWPLGIEEGHSRNARIGPLAATTSGGTDALGGAPLPGEAPAPPTSQALKDAPASLDESFLPGRPTDARRGAANLARAFSPRAKEAIQGGAPLEAGAKRRTGVVVSLEEEIRAKAREPKPRIKVQDPMPTYRLTQPSYPGAALKDGTEGFVRARFRVAALCTVVDFQVKISQTPGFFDQVVKEAIEQWKFTHARDQDGKPMEAWMQYNFQFQVRN